MLTREMCHKLGRGDKAQLRECVCVLTQTVQTPALESCATGAVEGAVHVIMLLTHL